MPFRIPRDVHEAVVERARPVRRGEHRAHVRHRRQDREPRTPPFGAIAHTEERRLFRHGPRFVLFLERDYGFGEEEAQILLEALVQLCNQ